MFWYCVAVMIVAGLFSSSDKSGLAKMIAELAALWLIVSSLHWLWTHTLF